MVAQPPPPNNTIEQDVGLTFNTVHALRDYFYRGYNVTAFFEALANWLQNHTMPQPVWEETVEWGLVEGTTGNWFNHTLPGEPVAILLQMHPGSLVIGGQYIIPNVYDKDDYHWQLELVWLSNQTQCFHVCRVMYHMRWEPDLADPNVPQEPNPPEVPP